MKYVIEISYFINFKDLIVLFYIFIKFMEENITNFTTLNAYNELNEVKTIKNELIGRCQCAINIKYDSIEHFVTIIRISLE